MREVYLAQERRSARLAEAAGEARRVIDHRGEAARLQLGTNSQEAQNEKYSRVIFAFRQSVLIRSPIVRWPLRNHFNPLATSEVTSSDSNATLRLLAKVENR